MILRTINNDIDNKDLISVPANNTPSSQSYSGEISLQEKPFVCPQCIYYFKRYWKSKKYCVDNENNIYVRT